jgi:SWI/SNF-related matrix-associated actin-dependent regulator 1 of chromatin subfamily A
MRHFQLENEYHFEGPYFFRHIPIQHGFKYNRKSETWITESESNYKSLVDVITIMGEDPEESTKDAIMKESRAIDSDYYPPNPEGLNYLPFQRAGIKWAMDRAGSLIGDDMGVGKTIQGIGVANAMNANRILIVCPSSLKINWKEEMDKWLINKCLSKAIIKSSSAYMDANVVIMNYDILGRFADRIRAIDWDLVILDEGHFIKNPTSNRTKYIVGGTVGKKKYEPLHAKKRVVLTGTPLLNKPDEVWTIAHWLAPEVFSNQYAFWQRYCDLKSSRFGKYDHSGKSNLTELQEILRSTFMIRRLKKDVLKDLPPKTRQVISIEPTKEFKEYIAQEQRAIAEARTSVADLKQAAIDAETSGNIDEYKNSVTKLKEGIRLGISMISRVRKETAVAKAPLMIKYVKELLEEKDKIIVFAHHKDVISLFMEAFKGNAVKVTGSDSTEDRNKSVKRFQNDPSVNIFMGSIMASGVGLTLTASSTVVFAELDWVPANISQAEDRAHRMGQKDNVLVQHFVLEGSLDANMARKVVEKQNMADLALDTERDELLNKSIKLDI